MLVTGASGAVGSRLLHQLRRRGWRSRCLVHRSPVPDADETTRGDLADPDSLAAAAAGVDAVVHLAAATHARRARKYHEANVAGTRRLAQAAAEAGVARLVHVSSRAATADGGAYSRSKLASEDVVRDSGVPATIVRLPEVYGAGGTEGVDRIIELARRGAPIPLVGSGRDEVCPMYADDAVAAVAAAVDVPAAEGRTYTLAGDCMTVRGFAERCIAHFSSDSRIVGVPTPLVAALGQAGRVLPLPVYPDQLARLRTEKPRPDAGAETELGFRARPLEEGLEAIA